MEETKFCKVCETTKPLIEFYIRTDTGKPRSRCKKCEVDSQRQYQIKNDDKVKETKRRYYQNKRKEDRLLRTNSPQIEKECCRCHETKIVSEFWDGDARCIDCAKTYQKGQHVKHKAKRNQESRDRVRHPIKSRESRLRCLYDMSLEEFDELNTKAAGRCAICKEEVERLNIDHDHETGKVRDLLCMGCNCGLGNFKEKPYLLEAAAEYLRIHSEKQNGGIS